MNLKKLLLVGCLSLGMLACSGKPYASINISGLNYTNTGISEFSVNGYWGGNIHPNSGGGSYVCCVSVPRRWRPDLKVTVRWTEVGKDEGGQKERVVAVPQYSESDIGFFAVHFYPGDVVKVLITVKTVGHPDYPFPRPK